jgi:hypothetical protein
MLHAFSWRKTATVTDRERLFSASATRSALLSAVRRAFRARPTSGE